MRVVLKGVSYFIERGLLLDEIDFSVSDTDRIGIVGRNGSGKSTLLKILANESEIHGGERETPENARILLVEQTIPADNRTPLDYLRDADKQIKALDAQLATTDAKNFGVLQDQITQLETERYEDAAPKVLRGLGISDEKQQRPINELSGGLRMRIALASALIQMPDLLLLDEPTNHLDLESVLWLSHYLQTYPKPFVMVSHDPTLLNTLVNKIYHVQGGKLTCYQGNYQTFQEQYQLKQAQAIETNKHIDQQQEKDQAFVDRFKAKPKWAGTAKSRERLMGKREAERPPLIPEEPPLTIEFPPCGELKNPIYSISRGRAAYDDKTILSDVNLSVQSDSRIGILGCNGQGKSTLVKLILGQLKHQSGDIVSSSKLKFGYFSQDQTDILNPEFSALEQLKSVLPHSTNEEIRKRLAAFGFGKDKVATPIKHLSGGEKTRLLFALIASQNPHLIILDEPTNHLDFSTKESLIAAIKNYNGAIIIVSHDWDLLANTVNHFWMVANGRVTPYNRQLNDYKQQIMASLTATPARHTTTATVNNAAANHPSSSAPKPSSSSTATPSVVKSMKGLTLLSQSKPVSKDTKGAHQPDSHQDNPSRRGLRK